MVMHARKLPRLNDGYFDRNAAHLHQGSGKFRLNEESSINNSNGPVNNINRSTDRSPERTHNNRYVNKTSYMQRLKEREKEKQLHSKDPNQSPMSRNEKSSSFRREVRNDYDQHRSSNHSRNASDDNKERRIQVGDWSEHISSSGKKYYYNCKTEVSQWEKPKGWLEWERAHGVSRSNHCDQPRHKQIQGSRNSSSSLSNRPSEKHSTGYRNFGGSSTSSSFHNHVSNSTSRSHDERQAYLAKLTTRPSGATSSVSTYQSTLSRNCWNNDSSNSVTSLNNVRLSDCSGSRQVADVETTQDMDISPASGDDTPTSSQQEASPSTRPHQTPTSSSSSQPQVSLAASLPKLLSQLASSKSTTAVNHDKSELSAHEALRTIKQALELTRHASTKAGQSGSPVGSSSQETASPSSSSTQLNQLAATIHHALEARIAAAAPPRLSEHDGRGSPGSECSHKSFSKRGSPTSSISSLHSLSVSNSNNANGIGTTSSLASLKPQTISLTPSLVNYYREDLISHVTGWQAEHAESQANKYGEEAFLTGSLNCTKVSAELKTCRSFVRLAEIQATLQEQRILFIRQQVKDLEEWKSQNLFMSDS